MNKIFFIGLIILGFVPIGVLGQISISATDVITGFPVDFSVSYISADGKNNVLKANDGVVVIASEKSQEVQLTAEGYEAKSLVISPNMKYNEQMFRFCYSLKDVVVTDVHSQKSVSATVLNISKISAKEIEDLGATDLRDVLSFENNIKISRDNALGSTGLSMMGIDGENVKIMVDGIPVIGRFFGQLDLEQFNIENAKQIEIVKGPMSVIYGSNALAGTINIVTKQEKKTGVSLLANHETDGQYNLSGTATKGLKNGKLSLSAGRMFFDGWSRENLDRTFDWLPKEQYTGNITYAHNTAKNKVVLKSEVMQSRILNRGTPLAPYEEMAIDQKYRNRRLDNSLSFEHQFKKSSIRFILGNNHFVRVKNKYLKSLVTLEETLVPLAADQDTQTFNASVMRAIYTFEKKGIETLVGFDGNYEIGEGKRIKDKSQDQLDLAGFLSAEKQINRWLLLRGGMRYAYNSAYQTPLIYSLQSRLNLKKSQLVKLAYGRGFRAPSLKELYLNFTDSNHEVIGYDSLLAEKSHSITGTYSKYYKIKNVEMNTSADLFFNAITNKIDLVQTSITRAKYGNIGLYESVGGEIHQKIIYKHFKTKIGFSYTGVYYGLGSEDRDYVFTPQLTVQPSYTFKKTNTSIQLYYSYFGKVSRVFEDTDSSQVVRTQDAYEMADFTINQPFLQKKLRATFGVRNLLGVVNLNSDIAKSGAHSASSSQVSISPGRTFFISLRYEFKK